MERGPVGISCTRIVSEVTFQGRQRLDNGQQLHAIVGGVGFPTPEFLFDSPIAQQGPPAAGARIAFAGAIAKNFHEFRRH